MANEWDTSICNEKSGFLFSHDCYMVPHETCQRCQKPICLEHSHKEGATTTCTTCAKKRRSRSDGAGRTRRMGRYDDYDPYFYGGFYHGYGNHGYGNGLGMHAGGHDPFDFTDADASGLVGDGDGGFENDMSAS